MIHWDNRSFVTILRIENGPVNAIDLEMFTELIETLQELKQSSSTHAVVLTGTGKAFSAGVDLFRVLDGGRDYIEKFLPILATGLEELFLFPKPVVVAMNGHAIAGGCIMACACDYRIAADGAGKIGVPELLVGVPFPAIALEIVRFAASSGRAQEIVYTGRYYNLPEAKERGLIDEIVQPEECVNRACEISEKLGSIPASTFRTTKHQLRSIAIQQVRQRNEDSKELVAAWSDPAIHEVIRKYLDKTIRK
jgi:enoyl-CoA hydratase